MSPRLSSARASEQAKQAAERMCSSFEMRAQLIVKSIQFEKERCRKACSLNLCLNKLNKI